MFKLDGKVAIVTGAAHGIGRAIAEVFAEAGARVTILDIDEKVGNEVAESLRCAGHQCTFTRADVASEDDVRKAVASAAGKDARVDVLCNNAAYLGPFHDLLNSTSHEWEQCTRVGLRGAYHLTREVLPRMIHHGGGSIINISSVQGIVAARESIAYSTIKTGIVGFTRCLAYDYGKHNIRANCICPGAITTRISPKPGEELYERQISKTMLGRVGKPRDIGYAALYLACDESAYVTGAIIPVDGGWTAI